MNKIRNLLEDISAAILVFLLFGVFILGVIVGMFDKLWIFLIIGLVFIIVITMYFTFRKTDKAEKQKFEQYRHKEENKE